MTDYVALLRAIGPVTHRTMPLKALVTRCATHGLGEVISLGNTGNLVLASPDDADAVTGKVAAAVASFGLELDVFVRTRRQIQMLLNAAPFPEAAAARPSALTVCFFRRAPNWPEAYRDYAGPERLLMFSNHLIVDYAAGTVGSRLTIEKTVGARMTQRNWNTVLAVGRALSL